MNHERNATGEDIGVHSLLSSLPNSLNCSTAITVLWAAAEALASTCNAEREWNSQKPSHCVECN